MSDVERVANALKDVQRAYYCPPTDPYMIHGAPAFAVAAKEARLEHIVGMTQWMASPSHPSLMTRQHWLVDRLFSAIPGVAHTIIKPGFFADDYLVTIGASAQLGMLPWMFGNSRNAPPSNEDIARVAVAALRTIQGGESQWTRAKSFDTFTPLGPYVETKIDPHDLSIQLFQNGQLRQNSNTRQLIFNCFQLVSFISTNMTLLPGDVILTGTPSGVGPIESGDRLEVRIQGLVPLVNAVK